MTPARILLVEDEEIITFVIRDQLESRGHHLDAVSDGQSAWNRLQAAGGSYDAILLDRGLPDTDGLDLLRRIKAEPRLARTPVIVETALADHDSVREGLAAGAYYYLTKPFQPEVLLAIVDAALQQAREVHDLIDSVRRAERPLALLQSGTFRFRDLDEGRLLANYLAQACPEPERTIQGLQELLVNAVEHGNLGISYEEKGALMLAGTWHDEVRRRLDLPAYRERHVEVCFERDGDRLRFSIQDQGAGFDWSNYLDFSPDRAFDLHGRGIAMSRKLCFDGLEYRGRGNLVVAFVDLAAVPPAGPSDT